LTLVVFFDPYPLDPTPATPTIDLAGGGCGAAAFVLEVRLRHIDGSERRPEWAASFQGETT
jgi:hypothetical protein